MEPNLVTLETVLAIGVTVLVLYGPWQKLVVEITRQRLFNIRAAVFDYAADGRLDFDSNEYRELTRQINLMIRFCHAFSWPHLLAILKFQPEVKNMRAVDDLVDQVADREVRQFVSTQVAKAGRALGWMLFFRSPLLMLVSLPVWLYQGSKAKTWITSAGSIIEREILEESGSGGRHNGHAPA